MSAVKYNPERLAVVLLARASIKVLDIKRIEWPQLGVAGGLFKFGGWMLVATISSMITDSLDRVLQGANLGARLVTYYTVPQNLVTRLNMLPNSLVRTLFPRLSAIKRDHADAMVRQSLEFLNGVFTPIALFVMLVLAPFLWVSVELARTYITGFPWALLGTAQVNKAMLQNEINFTGSSLPGYQTQVIPQIINPGVGVVLFQFTVVGPDGKPVAATMTDSDGVIPPTTLPAAGAYAGRVGEGLFTGRDPRQAVADRVAAGSRAATRQQAR